jgi:hypothetical protein
LRPWFPQHCFAWWTKRKYGKNKNKQKDATSQWESTARSGFQQTPVPLLFRFNLRTLLWSGFFFFFFVVLGLELRAFTLTHSTALFLWRVFWDRVSWTICLGWLQTTVLLISTSWVARITGVSHWQFLTYKNASLCGSA